MCPKCEGLVECWGSAGSAMDGQAEPLGQGVVKGAVSPNHIIRMSGFVFQVRDAPHSFLTIKKCRVHPS